MIGFKGFVLIAIMCLGGLLVKLEFDVEEIKSELRKKGWDD